MTNSKETKVITLKGDSVQVSSGNIFSDLDLPNPEERLAKAKLASIIHEIIEARGLTQQKAAELMRIDQPKVSKIIRGRLNEFSTDWLLSRVLHMDPNIDIVVHSQSPTTNGNGEIHVASVQ